MVYSLSEIDAQAKKAVRGAGFSWGHAEEAGKAVRLLAAYQLPGLAVLAEYLQQRDAQNNFTEPKITQGDWQPTQAGAALCPIMTGACLCDNGDRLARHQILTLHHMAAPLLVVPYFILISRMKGVSLTLNWQEGSEVGCHAGRLTLMNDRVQRAAIIEQVTCRVAGGDISNESGEEPGCIGQAISDEVWRQLGLYAQRTYVPATEASRRGAGPAE